MMNGLQPDAPVSRIPGIAARDTQALQAAGIQTVQQLLRRIPRRYEDRSSTLPVHLIQDGETVCARVHVFSAGWRFSYKRYFEVSAGTVDDPHGARIYLRWFNMPYVSRLLATGMNLSIYGKARAYGGKMTIANPDFEVLDDEDAGRRLVEAALGGTLMPPVEGLEATPVHTGRIVPIYRSVPGIAARNYRTIVWNALQQVSVQLPAPGYDVAPAYPYWQAVHDIHFPASEEIHRKARLRFALAECFEQQFRVAWRRHKMQGRPGQVTASCPAYMEEMLARLPFAQVGDPVVEARGEKIDREGGSSFRDYLLPEAVIKFRQGFGRLVRTKSDRGVVVVSDSRIVTKNYGATFRKSIPASVHTVTELDDLLRRVEDFFCL